MFNIGFFTLFCFRLSHRFSLRLACCTAKELLVGSQTFLHHCGNAVAGEGSACHAVHLILCLGSTSLNDREGNIAARFEPTADMKLVREKIAELL